MLNKLDCMPLLVVLVLCVEFFTSDYKTYVKAFSTFWIILAEYCKYKIGINTLPICIEQLTRRLSEISILYIKLFQWVSCEINNIVGISSVEMHGILDKYTDNNAYTEEDIDDITLRDLIYWSTVNNKVLTIDRNVYKAGTVALIYRARLNDVDVVIKIHRKNIKDKIREMMSLLKIISSVFVVFKFVSQELLDFIISYNEGIFYEQLNAMAEVDNMIYFYSLENCEKYVSNIKVYKEFTECFSNVIVMNYVEGRKFAELTKEEVIEYALPFQVSLQSSLHLLMSIHGDLHAGNVLFMPDNKVCVLDFGIYHRLSTLQQQYAINASSAILNDNWDLFIGVTVELCVIETVDSVITKSEFRLKMDELYKNKMIFKTGSVIDISPQDMMIVISHGLSYKLEMNPAIIELLFAVITMVLFNASFIKHLDEPKALFKKTDKILREIMM